MEQQLFYHNHPTEHLPLFHQPFWLDAVAPGAWDVVLIEQEGKLVASAPFVWKKSLLGTEIIMPKLTQFLGPNMVMQQGNYRERLEKEMQLHEQILKRFSAHDSFLQRWHFSYQNWLPYYWAGYHQTTRYTYVLDDISDLEILRKQFSDKVKREIKKAENNFIVQRSDDVSGFYEMLALNFKGKGMNIPFDAPLLQRIYKACKKNNAGDIWLSKDAKGKIAGGILVAWDKQSAYYIIGGKNDAFGNAGVMSHLFWKCFNDLNGIVKQFDFEGSMLKGVENYFRSFGAEQKGYFEISKINSAMLSMKAGLRKQFRK
ncbi:MAG: GNAT family N-acetyltransferase [Chitinophagaceae bacterium]|nr:GNAT family N-acetyltransferase [Chitinophagaceae bacterium]